MSKRKASELSAGDIVVMMNGLPGAMGHEVSAACLRHGMRLADIALTGPDCDATVEVSDGEGGAKQTVRLLDANQDGVDSELKAAVEKYGDKLVGGFLNNFPFSCFVQLMLHLARSRSILHTPLLLTETPKNMQSIKSTL